MSEKEARAFITQVAPLGTMDYSLLHKRPPMIKTNYGFSCPVPPATLVIGVVVIILLIAGIALGCYVYRMRKTFSLATGTIKKITDKPLSGCRRLFSRMHKRTRPLRLHVLCSDRGLSRTRPKPMQQKSTKYR